MAAHPKPELEQAMEALSLISGDLLASYRDLERRAQRVEGELSRANEELREKIEELDRVSRHLEAVLETLPTGVVVRDSENRVVRLNPAALEILGVDSEHLMGTSDYAVAPGLAGADATGEPLEVECADGTRRVIASRFSRIAANDTSLAGSVEILDDRTEVTELTERLHGLDKLVALGNMAGGIAHEIRNPMNAVKGYAALIVKHAEPESRQSQWANKICAGADEADEILASMLTLASPERLTLETIDARELVSETIATTATASRTSEGGEITSTVEPISFAGDRVKLRQALRNLIVNAIQAQGDDEARPRVHVEATCTGETVELRVTDAGPGVPDDLRRRVFDPFFTTRAEGTGLGLALVSTIARLHGGRVEIPLTPSPMGGADVRLEIPLRPPSART